MNIEVSDKNLLVSDMDFADFSPVQFEYLFNEYKKKTIVLHSDSIDEYLAVIRDNFKDNYFVQLGFTADKYSIPQFEVANSNLQSLKYENKEAAFNDIKETYESEKGQDWYKYIPESIHTENLSYLSNELDISKVYSLKSNEKLVATSMLFDSNFFTGVEVDQIGWIWIDRNLSQEMRKEAHQNVSNWLRDSLSKSFYQAGIHIENTRSQNFFKKLGFTTKCAHITKR